MNIFLCGQKSFGSAVLEELIKRGHTVVGVSPAPRGAKKDALEVTAIRKKVPVISDGEKLSYRDIPDGTDLIVAAHAHWIISGKALERAKYGGIGFHPSLLPLHRGRDAVRWAVHMGDKVTGGTVFCLTDKCDGGDVILQKPVFIGRQENYHDLWRRMFPIGVEMVCDAVDLIERGAATYEPQDEQYATFEPAFESTRLKRNDLCMISSSHAGQECYGDDDSCTGGGTYCKV